MVLTVSNESAYTYLMSCVGGHGSLLSSRGAITTVLDLESAMQ